MSANRRLERGAKVGAYAIVGQIGAGGMGEVYRAHDPKLTRDVAIKVVPPEFTGNPDRLARFEREARVLASLNHPHIAAIYGFDDSAGAPALVMELVEGPTLADRLRQGPMPLDQAIEIAGEIADALEYAHKRGIVHRDLKPGNVKVTSEGTVKVLDFGLAKALETGASPDQAEASTISVPATEAGVVLGTPSYMSPEQAAGKPVDRRTDVWAFGCVLYEMLSGSRTFQGETTTETMAAVMRGEPDWSRLPATTPPEVRGLLQRCLRKDRRQRLQAIGDARVALEEVRAATGSSAAPAVAAPLPRRRLAFELIGAAILAAVAGVVAWSIKPAPSSPAPVRSFTVALPAGQQLSSMDRGALAFSDDGDELAYVAATGAGDERQIYVRAMDTGAMRAIAGTSGAAMPFFSPDGQWLAFFADGKLKKVRVQGGAVSTLAVVTSAFGGSWSDQHIIAYAPLFSEIEQIPDEAGATPRALSQFSGPEGGHVNPNFLPGGQAVLFKSWGPTIGSIALKETAGRTHRTLVAEPGALAPAYVASGHVTYRLGTNLMAVPFDLARGEVTGDAVQVLQNVLQYAVSASGSLAYAAGSAAPNKRRLVWVSRSGASQVIDAREDGYYQPRLEPTHGGRIAMDLNGQIWMLDLATHNFAPFTFGDLNQHATWTRDGRQLVFMTQKNHAWQLSVQAADGSGKPEPIAADPGLLDIPYSSAPEGVLTVAKISSTAEGELWIVPVVRPPNSAAIGQRLFSIPIADADAGATFSPDGKWLAYAGSDAAGRRQIYVQAYPGSGDKHQVSIDGGNEPLWNPDTTRQPLELFYRNGDDMMAVDITTKPGFAQGKPHRLFQGAAGYQAVQPNYVRANYDVSPDGQRFLMLQPVGQEQPPVTQIHVVLNWAEELKRLAPSKKYR